MCIHAASIAVSKGVAESKELQDYPKADPAFKGFVDLAPNGWRWPTLPSYSKIMPVLDGAVASILLEEVGAKAGRAAAQQQAQQFLDDDVKLMK